MNDKAHFIHVTQRQKCLHFKNEIKYGINIFTIIFEWFFHEELSIYPLANSSFRDHFCSDSLSKLILNIKLLRLFYLVLAQIVNDYVTIILMPHFTEIDFNTAFL